MLLVQMWTRQHEADWMHLILQHQCDRLQVLRQLRSMLQAEAKCQSCVGPQRVHAALKAAGGMLEARTADVG